MTTKEYVPHSHLPYGADGSGFYSDNTIGIFNVMQAVTPIVLGTLEKFNSKDKKTFTICDYGTADGGTSMYLIKECVAKLRSANPKIEVNVLYEDQPVNDFKSLFMRLHSLIPGPPSYLKEFDGVYIAAVGTGFYEQCVPSNTVDLAFSSTAMHWLTRRPCPLKKVLHHSMCKDSSELEPFKAQAARDWNTILEHRAAELAPGGQAVIVSFCIDQEGQCLGNTTNVKASMFQTMTDLWQGLVKEGRITQEEFENTTFNNYYRSVGEYSAPFNDPNSPIYKAGLRLVSIETKRVDCPYHQKWMKSGNKEDPEAAKKHAKWFVPTTRTWSNHTFYAGLSESRSEQERNQIVDLFFQRYEDLVAKAPEDHAMYYIHAYMHIEKVK